MKRFAARPPFFGFRPRHLDPQVRPPFGVTLAAHVCVADPCWDDPLSGEELAWFPRGDALVPLQAWPFADWF